MNKCLNFSVLVVLSLGLLSCGRSESSLKLNYEQYTLDNGLKVVLQQDLSDPVVAVAIQYHVGSGREKPGKTGFAHFFEHMLFQRSENLPRNAFFQKISDYGGDFNGSTYSDGTNYYEIVPRNALEKILWMESDRMGFFINTVTQGGLEREIDIVSNEKRQNYDNRPYGQNSVILSKTLYPKGHPYSWVTIGDIADLRAATLNDVKEFYNKYYVPNNATLVISGDFNKDSTKMMVEKYFGEISRGADIEKPRAQPVTLSDIKKVVYEDSNAKMPMLTIAFPTVEERHPDSYALELMTQLISSGKTAPLYKIIVEEKKLAPNANFYNNSLEIAGSANLSITAYQNINLNQALEAVNEAFARFEKEGVNKSALERFKTEYEMSLYGDLEDVLTKAEIMASNNEFGGKPDVLLDDLNMLKKVTDKDIVNVYNKYIKGKNYVAVSIVPKGSLELALTGSLAANIVEESVENQVMKSSSTGTLEDEPYEFTPSKIDRKIEPALMSNTPFVKTPKINTISIDKGVNVKHIYHNELPLVRFNILLKGGMLANPSDKSGLASITAALMNEGTEMKTPEQLEEVMGRLGASIYVSSGKEATTINASTLSRNFKQVVELTTEILLHPRFDEKEFDRIKKRMITNLKRQESSVGSIANNTAQKLLFGADSPFAQNIMGTIASIDAITIDDVKAYYKNYYVPAAAQIMVVGDVTEEQSKQMFSKMLVGWDDRPLNLPVFAESDYKPEGRVFFVDYPGAKQSVVFVGKKAMPINSIDYLPAMFVNYRMGEGSNGRLFDELRLKRGYTYGAYSFFNSGDKINTFEATSNVQSSVTKESVNVFKELFANYSNTFDENDLDVTKNALVCAEAGAFETQNGLIALLSNIVRYNLPENYVELKQNAIKNMTLEQAKEVINRHMNELDMIYLIVGDAKTQLKGLEECGLGKVKLL